MTLEQVRWVVYIIVIRSVNDHMERLRIKAEQNDLRETTLVFFRNLESARATAVNSAPVRICIAPDRPLMRK